MAPASGIELKDSPNLTCAMSQQQAAHQEEMEVRCDSPAPLDHTYSFAPSSHQLGTPPETVSELQAENARLRQIVQHLREKTENLRAQRAHFSRECDTLSARVTGLEANSHQLAKESRSLSEKVKNLEGERKNFVNTLKHFPTLTQVKKGIPKKGQEEGNKKREKTRESSWRNFDALSDHQIQVLTSIPWKGWLECFAKILRNLQKRDSRHGLSEKCLNFENQVLFVFEKLRRDPPFSLMSLDWGLSQKFLRTTFWRVVRVLHNFSVGYMASRGVPTVEEIRGMPIPDCFAPLDNARFLIDCTDCQSQMPGHITLKRLMYSSYRGYHSCKFLLASTPTGLLCFVSDPFPGRTSDDDIVVRSEFLKLVKEGDLVLADKGFRIPERHRMVTAEVQFLVPAFLRAKDRMDIEELRYSRTISEARVHIERHVQRFKLFHILREINVQFLERVHLIAQLCGFLTNLQAPLFSELV